MGRAPRALGFAALVVASGCYTLEPFACTDAEQCVRDGAIGVCASPGYCAFEDDGCSSGLRFDGLASRGLAGQCVAPDDLGTSSSTSTSTTDVSTTALDSTSSGSSGDPDASTGTVNLCGDRPCACALDIVAGAEHTCALRDDGSIVCWGNDEQAALGRGVLGGSVAWPQQVVLPDGFIAERVVAGSNHGCAISMRSALACWGANGFGEVTPSRPGDPVATPQLSPWGTPAQAVSGALGNTCAVSEGSVVCWGDNGEGQLGDATASSGPATVGGRVPLATVEDVVTADRHACGRLGGDVWCWGTNFDGQLGTVTTAAQSADPVQAELGGPAGALVTGALHTCATVDDGTRVQCWGSGGSGQIGTGDGLDADVPVDVLLPRGTEIVQLASHRDGTCALTRTGDLYCWGSVGGDIFNTGTGKELAPVRVDVPDALPEPVERIAMGLQHLCVLTEGGHVFCWGSDAREQLGPFDPPLGMRAVELDLACDDTRGR